MADLFASNLHQLGKNATETYQMLKLAFEDHTMGRTQVFEWFAKLKSGVTCVKDAERAGRPSTSKTDENELVHENRRITIRELADTINISFGSVQSILKDNLNMCRIAAKFVPHLLSEEQKSCHHVPGPTREA